MLGFFVLVHVWMIFQQQFIIRGFNFSLCGGVRHIQDIIKWSLACVASVSNRVIARKLERKQKKGPPSFFFFFCSCPSFLDESREETLATQAKWSPFGKCAAVKTSMILQWWFSQDEMKRGTRVHDVRRFVPHLLHILSSKSHTSVHREC